MPKKLLLALSFSLVLGVGSIGCSKPAQDEAHAPQEVERAVNEAEEQSNRARTAAEKAETK